MRITLADGMHYCYDCGELILDTDHESVWYCPKDAKRRGWNIIDGRRVKISNENENNGTVNETNSTTDTGESISEKTK
jgi:hypothetical protein